MCRHSGTRDIEIYVSGTVPFYWFIVNGAAERPECDASSLGIGSRNLTLEDEISNFCRNVGEATTNSCSIYFATLDYNDVFKSHLVRYFRASVCIRSTGAANEWQSMWSAGGEITDGKEEKAEVLLQCRLSSANQT